MRRIILLLICWCTLVNVHAESVTCQQRHCMGVVDAGSTGSRLHLFAYDLDTDRNPIHINELSSKKIKPGFATIEPTQEAIDAYLSRLFDKSTDQSIPVYFYATAGMRLLPQSQQKLYYRSLGQWFAQQTQWQLIDSRTITGRDEGVFGWLAVNYKLGTLDTANKPLVSVMDMGGASVQLTFPVQNVEKIDTHDLFPIDIYGRHFVLFVHSFLGLGQTAISQQYLNAKHCFSDGYELPSGWLGEGDALACQRDVSKLINQVHEVNSIVKPAITENTTNSWYAMGAVAALAGDKPFSFENRQFTNRSLLEQADNKLCHQQWQDLYNQYPNNDFLYSYCFSASYFYALMVDGYGLQPEQPISYLPPEQSVDWSLGVVLHQH